MNIIRYESVNKNCKAALDALDSPIDRDTWIVGNQELYKLINIQPKGLPAIADCNFEGIRYEHIAKFHSLYSKTLHFKQ